MWVLMHRVPLLVENLDFQDFFHPPRHLQLPQLQSLHAHTSINCVSVSAFRAFQCNMVKAIDKLLKLFWIQKKSPESSRDAIGGEEYDRQQITKETLDSCERLGQNPLLSPIYKLNRRTVVKCADGMTTAEADTMRLVRAKTTIPVPEVFDTFTLPNSTCGCILMEYVEGERLDKAWGTYSSSQKRGIVTQLRQYMDELRSISGDFIGPVNRTPCVDQFFGEDTSSYGPFKTQADFHFALEKAVKSRGNGYLWPDMVIRFIRALPQHHRIVLTHGDLAPQNSLVKGSRVVAIIDWEFSGFYPEYWEYFKSHLFPDRESSWMRDHIFDKILDPFTMELAHLMHATNIIR